MEDDKTHDERSVPPDSGAMPMTEEIRELDLRHATCVSNFRQISGCCTFHAKWRQRRAVCDRQTSTYGIVLERLHLLWPWPLIIKWKQCVSACAQNCRLGLRRNLTAKLSRSMVPTATLRGTPRCVWRRTTHRTHRRVRRCAALGRTHIIRANPTTLTLFLVCHRAGKLSMDREPGPASDWPSIHLA